MKILFAGPLDRGASAGYRLHALERLGHTVIPFNTLPYQSAHGLVRKLEFRLVLGPEVRRLNRDLLALAGQEKPDVFWSEKTLKVEPATLRKMGSSGITTVSYMVDNAFGPRRDPGWRLYRKCLPLWDLHVTQRDVSLAHYRERGARDVMKVQTAYEQTVHFAADVPVGEDQKLREVSFIGTPYDDRAELMARLAAEGVPVVISGNPRAWGRALEPAVFARIFRAGELYERDYREAIQHAKINLSFLTRSNQDEYTHKSFEIAGCGGFLLAERSAGHLQKFVEDQEAVFFEGYDELKEKIARWLPDVDGRARIAKAGHERAVRDEYHNEGQMKRVMKRVAEIRKQ